MDVADMITEIDGHGFEDTETAAKLLAINDTLWDIESREPWPFLEKTIALNTDGTSPVPTNFPSDFSAVIWIYDNTNRMTLWPERLSTIRDNFGWNLATVGEPQSYYFVGSSLRLYPMPASATGRFQMDYYASQPELTDASVEANILLPPRHHPTVVVGALWKLYQREDDPEQAQVFQSRYETRLAQMRESLFRRQYQRSDAIYVIDEDDELDWDII